MIVVGFLQVGPPTPIPRIMVASVRRAMRCRIVQMSDEQTEPVEGVDDVIRKPWDRKYLMPYRLLHLRDFPADDDAIFLDADIVVRKDLTPVFDREFDIAVTTREEHGIRYSGPSIPGFLDPGDDLTRRMPYNAGVLFHRPSARGFWAAAHQYCETLPANLRKWWGDQLAIKHVADAGVYRLIELPCQLYNHTPLTEDEDVSGKFIVHYKGDRKTWMLKQYSHPA